jgi:hypothetical protein
VGDIPFHLDLTGPSTEICMHGRKYSLRSSFSMASYSDAIRPDEIKSLGKATPPSPIRDKAREVVESNRHPVFGHFHMKTLYSSLSMDRFIIIQACRTQ